MPISLAGAFWNFSLDRYARPGVAPLCLHLQDETGLDVNILIFCIWCGQRRFELGDEHLRSLANGDVGHWHSAVVRPLRAARRATKEPPALLAGENVEALRTRLKAIELEAERLEQHMLAGIAASWPGFEEAGHIETDRQERHHLATANVTRYVAMAAGDRADAFTGSVAELVERTTD